MHHVKKIASYVPYSNIYIIIKYKNTYKEPQYTRHSQIISFDVSGLIPGNKFDLKRRFQMPSPALSLPSLSSLLLSDPPPCVTERDRDCSPHASERERDRPIISSAGGVYQKKKKQELKRKGKETAPVKSISPVTTADVSK